MCVCMHVSVWMWYVCMCVCMHVSVWMWYVVCVCACGVCCVWCDMVIQIVCVDVVRHGCCHVKCGHFSNI